MTLTYCDICGKQIQRDDDAHEIHYSAENPATGRTDAERYYTVHKSHVPGIVAAIEALFPKASFPKEKKS